MPPAYRIIGPLILISDFYVWCFLGFCPLPSSLFTPHSPPWIHSCPPGFSRIQTHCPLSWASDLYTSLLFLPVLCLPLSCTLHTANSLNTPFQNLESFGDLPFSPLCSHIQSAIKWCISPAYSFNPLLLQLFSPVCIRDQGVRAASLHSGLMLGFASITSLCLTRFWDPVSF